MKTRRQMVLSVPVTELAPAVVVLSSREAEAAKRQDVRHEGIRQAPTQLELLAYRAKQPGRRSRERVYTVNGITRNVSEWAKATGISKQTILSRITRYGWDPAEAVKAGRSDYQGMSRVDKQRYAIKRARQRMG